MAVIQPQDPRIQTNEPQHHGLNKVLHHDFLSLAFRPFFLLAALSSIVSLGVWVGFFLGHTFTGSFVMTPHVWHVHEMIFGFAATVAVGFVLTAAQTWTKLPSLSKGWILLLVGLWLVVRAGLYINTSSGLLVAIAAQVSWWSIVIFAFARLLFKSENKRNYVLLPVMSVIGLLNVSVIASPFIFESQALTMHIARTAVLAFVILMGLMGGRVIPFFTASGARIPAPQSPSWMTPLVASVSVIGALFYFVGYFVELPFTPASIMILGGVLHLWRLSFWQSKKTLAIPLLWSLHLSYLLMGLGMILLGLSYFLSSLAFSDALHMITIGAIGLMIFAMMSRVSLGHTGRALKPSGWMSVAFLLMGSAALIRVVLAVLHFNLIAWVVSAALWVLAAAIFFVIYLPILWRNEPR